MENLTEILAVVGGVLLVATPLAAGFERAALAFYEYALTTDNKKDDKVAKKLVEWSGKVASGLEWLSEKLPVISRRGGRQ